MGISEQLCVCIRFHSLCASYVTFSDPALLFERIPNHDGVSLYYRRHFFCCICSEEY